METLAAYVNLIASSNKVIAAMDEIMKLERLSPAWYKAVRVNRYLMAQACHVMEGRTEDGEEKLVIDTQTGDVVASCASAASAPRVRHLRVPGASGD